jgi:integrase
MVQRNSTSRALQRLTVKEIEATGLDGRKIRKLSDGGGLVLVMKDAARGISRFWHFRYRDPLTSKEQTHSLGVYPAVGLADAREQVKVIKTDLTDGITPKDRERMAMEQLAAARLAEDQTFNAVARVWYDEAMEDGLWSSDKHSRVIWESMERHVLPFIGSRPIAQITGAEIRELTRRMGQAGVWETASRVLQRIAMVYDYAEDNPEEYGMVESAPTGPAKRWLKRTRPQETRNQHFAFLKPDELPVLAQALVAEQNTMNRQTWLAIQLLALTFVRPGELRHAEWSEFDWDARLWRIPGQKMKARRDHVVPLSAPAVVIMDELRILNGNRRWVFPGRTSLRKPMSEATVNMALRRLADGAFAGRHTGHSFRHSASTWANGYRIGNHLPFKGDITEAQLAHVDSNQVRRTYNQQEWLGMRRELMDAWGAFWLACRDTEQKVVPIRGEAS